MDDEKIKAFLEMLLEELKDDTDVEYNRYLKEKVDKVFEKVLGKNFRYEYVVKQILQLSPQFIEEYKRYKDVTAKARENDDTRYGISISFELIDLFDIANVTDTEEEFSKKRDEYFENLGKNPRMKGFDHIFFGLKDISREDVLKVQKNVLENVDCITPEWAGKMRCVINDSPNIPVFVDGKVNDKMFNFELLDKVANFARKNNMKLRMHTLVWHKDYRMCFDSLSNEELYTFLDTYMSKLNERYGDVLYAVDVLNEIASDNPGEVLRDSKWREKLGDDYFIRVLEIAKKNFPNIPLYYNEYKEQEPDKLDNILKIIDRIKEVEREKGITLLDGIGLQAHYDRDTPDENIKRAFEEYSKTGKKLSVTELDVTNMGGERVDLETNRVFRTVLDCASSYGLDLINNWGVSSNISWKSGKVGTFLGTNNEISTYASKIIDTYSHKKKELINKQNMNI